jgi:hypothetical protein
MARSNLWTLVLGAVLGFLGGMVGGAVRTGGGVATPSVVEAKQFELVNDSGAPIAFWGYDSGGNAVLAFVRRYSESELSLNGSKRPPVVPFTGQSGNERVALGMRSDGMPFIDLVGKDSEPRTLFYTGDDDKPIMVMGDEHHEVRVMLGFLQDDAPSPKDDDWGLAFRNPDLAGIGVRRDPVTNKQSGWFQIKHEQGRVRRVP